MYVFLPKELIFDDEIDTGEPFLYNGQFLTGPFLYNGQFLLSPASITLSNILICPQRRSTHVVRSHLASSRRKQLAVSTLYCLRTFAKGSEAFLLAPARYITTQVCTSS